MHATKKQNPRANPNGQAMVEAVIALPIILMLFAGMVYFHVRSFNQARTHIAARHACWLGSQGKFDKIPQVMTNFFSTNSASYSVTYSNQYVDVEQPTLVKPVISLLSLLGYKTDHNPKVTVQYTQAKYSMGIMITPNMRTTNQNASLDFMWTNSANTAVTFMRCDSNYWDGDSPWATRLALAAYVGFNL